VNSTNYFCYNTDVSRITVCIGQLSMQKASYYNSIPEAEGFLAKNSEIFCKKYCSKWLSLVLIHIKETRTHSYTIVQANSKLWLYSIMLKFCYQQTLTKWHWCKSEKIIKYNDQIFKNTVKSAFYVYIRQQMMKFSTKEYQIIPACNTYQQVK